MAAARYKVGLGALALAMLTWVPGFLTFDMLVPALACVVMAAGTGAAAFGRRTGGLVAAATAAASWVVVFLLAGFGLVDVLAAALLAVGFAIAAMAPARGMGVAAGLAIGGLGNLWYLANNTFLGGTPSFAPGNWLFLAGGALAIVAALQGDGAPGEAEGIAA